MLGTMILSLNMEGRAYLKGNKIVLEFQYSGSLVARVKELPGRRYHPAGPRRWEVPASAWHAQQVLALADVLTIEEPVKELAKELKGLVAKSNKARGRRIKGLFSYQGAAVDFIGQSGGRCIVADDIGLGKTVEVLAWVKEAGLERIWVVSPASVVLNWRQEYERWVGDDLLVPVLGYTSDLPRNGTSLVMSYNVMAHRIEELAGLDKPDLIVFDEAHALKGRRTKVARVAAAYELVKGVPHLLMVSATPFPNRPIELYNLVHMLDPLSWPNMRDFGNRYCGGYTPQGWYKGATNLDELNERLRTVMIRRLKADVAEQLPDLRRTYLPVVIPNMVQYTQVKREVEDALLNLNPESKGYFVNALDKLNALRYAVGIGKAGAALEWATNFLSSSNRKLVLYCHHHDVVQELEKGLEDFGVMSLTGKVGSLKKRQAIIESFQEQETPRALVVTSAGGEGINLYGKGGVEASDILFVEQEWTPILEEQAEGRLHRQGQHNAVNAWYLVAQGTMDEKLAQTKERKRGIIRSVVDMAEVETTVASDVLTSFLKGE